MPKLLHFLVALLAAAILAIMATTPPSRVAADAAPTVFSAERAMADVRIVARSPHPTGSAENAEVRAYLLGRMRDLGMETATNTALIGDRATARLNKWSGRNDPPATLTNLVGVLPGKDRSLPAVMLMSHHDSVWGSPGAPDDTAGVAASLEIVRAIKAQGQPARDLVVLMTDAEELGLEGAEHFFAKDPLRSRIGVIVNMEARGGGGRTTLFQTSAMNGAAVARYSAAVERPAASSLAVFVYSVLPNDTDLTPALKGPYTAYNFAFIGRPGLYHSPKATPERLDQGSLQDMGDQALDLTRALLGPEPLPAKAPDAVFFDLFGLFTVVYPAWAGWIMLAVALGGFAFAARRDGLAGWAEGAGRMVALLIGAGLLFYSLNLLSIGTGKPEYYDRLAAIPRLELMVGLGSVVAFLLAFGRPGTGPGQMIGAAIPLAILAIGAQAVAPTASYVLVFTLLLVALGLASGNPWAKAAAAALVAGYMLALGHQLMQGVGPTMPFAAALPLALAALALLPVWQALGTRAVRGVAAGALLGAVAVAFWVQLDAPADTAAVYATTAARK